jgi:hypothetical protein
MAVDLGLAAPRGRELVAATAWTASRQPGMESGEAYRVGYVTSDMEVRRE